MSATVEYDDWFDDADQGIQTTVYLGSGCEGDSPYQIKIGEERIWITESELTQIITRLNHLKRIRKCALANKEVKL